MKKKKNYNKPLVYFGRTALIILTVLAALLVLAYSVMFILAKGPSPTASNLFVQSVMETSAAKFLARIYFTEAEIAEILKTDTENDDVTDPSLIQIPSKDTESDDTEGGTADPEGGTSLPPEVTDDPADGTDTRPDTGTEAPPPEKDDGIEIVKIQGKTYNGTLMIVTDPGRVTLGTLPAYGEAYRGKSLRDFVSDAKAIGGINAGGFWDEGGNGTGAVPEGIVICGGEIVWGDAATEYKCVIGFDKNHVLIVGNMTGAEALDRGIVEGLNFEHGPMLVCNGVPQNTKRPLGGGLNPRTAIGQRADGAVLLMVINGRQADSLGATYNDLVNEMVKHGAINAANLDGGSSTLMVYNGETMNQSAYFFGERKLPNVFLVGAGEA